jgi:hypothetical protein
VSYRLDRCEMKFVLNSAQRAKLMDRIESYLRPDANADSTAYYPIVSMYYDSPERDCYWEHKREQGARKKLRVRVYGSLDGHLRPTSFIEIKHKEDNRGVKRRAQMCYQEAVRVAAGAWPENVHLNEADRRTITEVHDLINRRGYRPILVMRYDRRAYASIDPESDLRITFDTGIAYRLHNLSPVPDDQDFIPSDYLYPDDISILEVKVMGTVPYWLSRAIPEVGGQLRSHSKYINALERSEPVTRSMLAPNCRKPLPEIVPAIPAAPSVVAGREETDVVAETTHSAMESTRRAVVG